MQQLSPPLSRISHRISYTPSLTCTPSLHRPHIGQYYIPTINPKKYNPLKIRELIHHKAAEKENREFRKKSKLPFPNSSQKHLSKNLSYSCFKPTTYATHPAYSLLQLQHRRAHEYYNCKRKHTPIKTITSTTPSPFLTDSTHSKRYEEYAQ